MTLSPIQICSPQIIPQVDKVSNPQSNSVHKSEKIIFKAPVKGTFEDISQVNDEVFSQKMMGEGFAIKPENGKFIVRLTLQSYQSLKQNML